MQIENLQKILINFESQIVYNQDLKKKNWFNIGGKAKIFFKAENLKDLVKFLKILKNKENIFVLGAGSNTLITDDIYDGVVIKLGKNFNRLSLFKDDIIISGSSVLDKNLAKFAYDNSLVVLNFYHVFQAQLVVENERRLFDYEIKFINFYSGGR